MSGKINFQSVDGETWPAGGLSSVQVINNKTKETFDVPVVEEARMGMNVVGNSVKASGGDNLSDKYNELVSMYHDIMKSISGGFEAVGKEKTNPAFKPSDYVTFSVPEPIEEEAEQDTEDWLSEIGLPFLAPQVKDPTIRVTFETLGGTFQTKYHAVIEQGDLIVLISDTRCDRDHYTPPKSPADDPVYIMVTIDDHTIKVAVGDIDFTLGPLAFQVLFAAP